MAPAVFTVVNTADAGVGSLRAAIASANAAAGTDTINFNIPGGGVKTINVLSALPTVTGKVTIAGNTQPGFAGLPLIELNGAGAAGPTTGLVLKASGCVARSLVINNFHGNGVLVFGSSSVVEGCFIGTNNGGVVSAGNQFHGVLIAGAATGVRVGSTTLGMGNVISGNGLSGVAILGSLASSNLVQGNFIGTNRFGTGSLGNAFDGVFISGGAKNNLIGGTVANAGNLISANLSDGIEISGAGTTGNRVQANTIGTTLAGNVADGNLGDGVALRDGASSNTIGGTVPAARNLISANGSDGIEIAGSPLSAAPTTKNVVQGNYIGTDLLGNADLGNSGNGVSIGQLGTNNTVGGTAAGARNVISGNDTNGVQILGTYATGNVVLGNYLGTNSLGLAGIGNNVAGVAIAGGANKNTVGGTSTAARNVISGNFTFGVAITGLGTTLNKVLGNYIGLQATGTAKLGNTFQGVVINGASDNTLGGTTASARNIISGNNADGVTITGAGAEKNRVQGNFIGTDATGTIDLGNGAQGVRIESGAENNTVGGTIAGARNVISGNNANGILITDAGSDYNLVQGNYLGTNAAGTLDLGNTFNGVAIVAGATHNTLGGAAAGARNIISGNDVEGVLISGLGTDDNEVGGNYIGTNAAGTAAIGNTLDGVLVQLGAASNTIGLVGMSLARNVISGNGRCGVFLWTGATKAFIGYNLIGQGPNASTPIPNASHGIFVTQTSSDNFIAGNRIANNGGDGVLIGSDPGAGFNVPSGGQNLIVENSIYGNAGQGIDLGPNDGPTPNDPNDVDVGPNDLINTPVITSAFLSGTKLLLSGYLNTEQNKLIYVQFFASPTGGQGKQVVGISVSAMGASNTAFFTLTVTVSSSVAKGHQLTATASEEMGGTSEFSLPVTIE